jgi:phosphoribosylaminoimidazole-succinocarboxamide synthase
MPLKSALGKLEDAWEYISQNSPDSIRAAAEMMHKTDVALFKAADFIDNLSPNASASSADAKAEFGVTSEKLTEIKSDLEHLRDEISAATGQSEDQDASAAALNPALKALLMQLLNKAIEELIGRIGM